MRRLPDESMKELVASGLMRVNQSKRWGGPELGTETAVEVIAEVAKGDTSAGWVCGLIASHFWLICLFSPEVQEEIWGDDNAAMMSSSFAPSQGDVRTRRRRLPHPRPLAVVERIETLHVGDGRDRRPAVGAGRDAAT